MLDRFAASAFVLVSLLAAPAFQGHASTFKKAGQLREEGRHRECIVELEKIVKSADAPNDLKARAYYSLGCCQALLKDKKKAVDAVVKAIELGFSNAALLEEDPDIESVRKDPRIAAATKRLRAAESDRAMAAAREKLAAFQSFPFDFALTTIDGKRIAKEDLEGKVAIVDVWGTWCGPCRMEIPHFVELAKRYKAAPFAIVGLNEEGQLKGRRSVDDAAKLVREFAQVEKIPYPLALIDEKTIAQIPGFSGFPTTLFLDRTGKVRFVEVGYTELSELDGIVQALLQEGSGPKTGSAPAPERD